VEALKSNTAKIKCESNGPRAIIQQAKQLARDDHVKGRPTKSATSIHPEAHEGYPATLVVFVSADTKGMIEEEVKSFIEASCESDGDPKERTSNLNALAQGLLKSRTLTVKARSCRVMAKRWNSSDDDLMTVWIFHLRPGKIGYGDPEDQTT
jgi:hypothetical protein